MAATVAETRTALITGISGQDGSFLAELLLEEGYRVAGTVRAREGDHLGASAHLRDRLRVLEVDLLDYQSVRRVVAETRPSELYHLAGPSFVPDSWAHPARFFVEIAGATSALLEAVRDQAPNTRVFVASSGTMFGAVQESPQREETAAHPRNPYAAAKLAAHHLAGQLRDHDGLFICSGILYNHESERRPETFVSRKVTRAAAAIKLGLAEEVLLGSLEAVRDWSFAEDIMRGAWLTLQQAQPDDYILASGVPHTVAELAAIAFDHVDLVAKDHIRVDPALVRSEQGQPLVGDPRRARERLGWQPRLGFRQLIERMVEADLRELGEAL
jgi:GDPmannose 4,6-dehydratase